MMNQIVCVELTVLVVTVSVSLAADVVVICPDTWQVDRTGKLAVFLPVELYCIVLKSSLKKCTIINSQLTTFQRVNAEGEVFTLCGVNWDETNPCESFQPLSISGGEGDLPRPTVSCGCKQNKTHFKFIAQLAGFPAPPDVLTDGYFVCNRTCVDDNLDYPLSTDISDGCYKAEGCDKQCPNEKLDKIQCRCVCDSSVRGHQCHILNGNAQESGLASSRAAERHSSPVFWLVAALVHAHLVLNASALDRSVHGR